MRILVTCDGFGLMFGSNRERLDLIKNLKSMKRGHKIIFTASDYLSPDMTAVRAKECRQAADALVPEVRVKGRRK